jgi:hypothetical protein
MELIYSDWQNETQEEGFAELLEYRGETLPFSVDGQLWKGETWLVRFDNGFECLRTLRVATTKSVQEDYSIGMHVIPEVYNDKFQFFNENDEFDTELVDTTFWNDRIEDFESYGQMY